MISQPEFEAAVQRLAFQDALGRHWMLGKDDGLWYTYNGQAWVVANPQAVGAGLRPAPTPTPAPVPPPAFYPQPPPPQYAYTPPAPYPPQAYYPPPKKGWGCWPWLACGCMTVLLLVVATGVGGFVAYQSGLLTLDTVWDILGMGPATVEIDNFRDEAINVTITQLDVAEDSYPSTYSYTLNPFDVVVSTISQAGRYEVKFFLESNGAELGACNLTLDSGDSFQFVPLPDQIVVNDIEHPVDSGVDLVVGTSSLCR